MLSSLPRKRVPRPAKNTTHSRAVILRFLLLCTFGWLFAAFTLLVVSMLFLDRAYVWPRVVETVIALSFIASLYVLARRGRVRPGAYVLVGTYQLLVVGMYSVWGINNLQAMLLAAFAVIISGFLLGARYPLYIAAFDSVLLFVINGSTSQAVPPSEQINNINIALLSIILSLIALVTWLYNDQMERALRRAEKSEAALKAERDQLEVKVERRTKKLQAAQIEQLQQVYRFAELGQVSTALLHDLANHLTAISVDIEGLEDENNSRILSRVRRTIRYIDNAVHSTRRQLEGQASPNKGFSPQKAIQEVIKLLEHRAQNLHTKVLFTIPHASITLQGDSTRFKQLCTNVIANAIDAHEGVTDREGRVEISLSESGEHVIITVADNGIGLSPEQKQNLFKPFYTTKTHGMGLGLFTSKEIVEKGFGGTIRAKSHKPEGMIFTISLPLEQTDD